MEENFNITKLKEQSAEGHGSDAAPDAAAAAAAAAAAEAAKKDPPPGGETKTAAQLEEEKKNSATAAPGAVLTDAEKAAAATQAAAASSSAAASASQQGKPLTQEEITALATKQILEGLGVDSMDALKAKLAPQVVLSPEQQAAAVQQYESNIDNYAVTKGLMTREDLVSLANVIKSDATTLAFNEFTKDFKATKADATATEIEQAFKIFYNVESTDETLKAIGAKKIEQIATGIKGELSAKRDAAKAQFDAQVTSKSKVPGFALVIQSAIKANVPEEITLLTDGDNKPVFKITPEIKKELEAYLVQQDLFDEYASAGATQQLSDKLKDRINGFLKLKNFDTMIKTAYDAGVGVGAKNGSTTGATASFKTGGEGTDTIKVEASEKDFTPAETEKLGKVFGGVNR